jgi:hypothetical protein
MGFQKGNKLSGSRKGRPNKLSLTAAIKLSEIDYCPIEKLVEASKISLVQFAEELEKLNSGRYSPMESKASQYLKIFLEANRELASYVHPKLKSIEQTKAPNPLDGLPDEKRLELMEAALNTFKIQLLAQKVKDGPSAT